MFLLPPTWHRQKPTKTAFLQVVPFFFEKPSIRVVKVLGWPSFGGRNDAFATAPRPRPSSMSRDRKLLGRFPTRQRKNTEVVTKAKPSRFARPPAHRKSLPPRPKGKLSIRRIKLPFRDSEPRGRNPVAKLANLASNWSINSTGEGAAKVSLHHPSGQPKELRLMKKSHKAIKQ